MASKKNFQNKKPEMQIQAEAVEAFMGNSPTPAPADKQEEQAPSVMPVKKEPMEAEEQAAYPVSRPEEQKASFPFSPAPFSRKAKVNKENKRSKRLQLLITEEEYNYLSAAAWLNRRSVNDYMNMLIEEDMKKNPDAVFAFKGGK